MKRNGWHRLAPWFAAAWLAAHFLFLTAGASGVQVLFEPGDGGADEGIARECGVRGGSKIANTSRTCCGQRLTSASACCHRKCCVEKPSTPSDPIPVPATLPVQAKVTAVAELNFQTALWLLPDAALTRTTDSAFSPGSTEAPIVPLFLRHATLLI